MGIRIYNYTVDSRYSGSLKYGHLDIPAIWLYRHGMLAIRLLHKTHPEVRPLAIPYTGQYSAGCPKQGFNVILHVYYAGYDVLGVV